MDGHGLRRLRRRMGWMLWTLLALPSGGARATTEVMIRGRLVLPEGERVEDWRIAVGPRLHAQWPSREKDLRGAPVSADGAFRLLWRMTPDFLRLRGERPLEGRAPRPKGGTPLRPISLSSREWVYVVAYANGRLDVESVVPVRLRPGRTSPEPVRLQPRPLRERVEFVLRNREGQPLHRRVKVHLYNAYGEVTATTDGVWSDEQGVVRFQRLPATRYDIWVERVAGAEGEAWPSALFSRVEVTPGADTQRIPLTMPSSGSLRGRLVLADGRTPAAGYVVAVQTGTVPEETLPPERWPAAYARGAQGCYAEARTAADGTFLLTGLVPGRHALDIRRPGERRAWCTITDVEVRPGETTEMGRILVAKNGWRYLLEPKALSEWVESDFYDPGPVRLENDRLVMEMGDDMTGITWQGTLPRVDYEVTLQAMRVAGDDFFCGLTFPVKQAPCTLILGGWGGSVVGLSCLDGYDASENETSQWIEFENRRWYRIRLRVTHSRIEAWLDGRRIIRVDTEGREISIRLECEPSRPLGIATWRTTGAVRDIRLRLLDG